MKIVHSLFAKLAIGLTVLLFAIGLLYMAINTLATKQYVARLNQDLHRSLAKNLVADKNLVQQGQLNEEALKQAFSQYMVVNPSIEIYLLDLQGKLLSYSVDPQSVMRDHVNLAPIKAFLTGTKKYPRGDDPRSHDKQKAFSVTQVPSNQAPEGYLYVVLRGEQYEAFESMAFADFWTRAGWWSMVVSLGLGLLVGLAIFYWLTKRLRRVSFQMESFNDSNFTQTMPIKQGDSTDEIDQIEQIFSNMAQRIQGQLLTLTTKDKQRRELVAQVSHDLRTPLASMLGYLESLRLKGQQTTPDEQEKYLDIVQKQGHRLRDMIDRLFELSSLEAKEIKPMIEPFIPLELVYDLQQKHYLRAKEADLNLQVLAAQSNVFALGDVALFERVLDNIIINAFAHATPKSTIDIGVQHHEEQVIVTIHNRGQAISEDQRVSIFEPFFRAKQTSGSLRHAGLGLAIAKRLIQGMHGSIDFENVKGGVTFIVKLPINILMND